MEWTNTEDRKADMPPMEPRSLPVLDISYVELPDRLTHRIDLSGIFGAIAFLAMIAATAFVEENPLMAVAMTAVFGLCMYLALKEDGQIK